MKFLKTFLKVFLLTLWDTIRKNYFYHSSSLSFSFFLSLAPLSFILISFIDFIPNFDLNRFEIIIKQIFPSYATDIIGEILEVKDRRIKASLLAFLISYVFSVGFIRNTAKALSYVSEDFLGERKEWFYWILMPVFLIGGLGIISLSFMLSIYIKLAFPLKLHVEIVYTLPGAVLFFFLYLSFLKRKVSFLKLFGVSFFLSLTLFLIQIVFSWYITHLFRGNLFYGSLSAVVVFLLWINTVFTVLLIGARLIYRMEKT